MISLEQAAYIILNESLAVQKGEKVLIITDESKENIGKVLYTAAKTITKDTELVKAPLGKISGEEPPEEIAKKMLEYDVILIPKNISWTHTNAVKAALEKGARAATLPGITEETMQRAINVDYEAMAKLTNKVKDILDKGRKVHITTEAGTDIKFSIEGRDSETCSGMIRGKGMVKNLPGGEAFIAPVEGTADGNFIIDSSVLKKKVNNPITVTVENGYAVNINGDEIAEELRKALDGINHKDAFNIAEFGIGTNDKAEVTGNTLEDEKVIGTCHLAFGKNIGFGGNVDVPIHIDGILLNPTIYVDDEKIMDNGKLL